MKDAEDARLAALAREVLLDLVGQIETLDERIARIEGRMVRRAREDATARRLATIPGIGALGAMALAALVTDPQRFATGRHFAASIGLSPQPHSSGGKERLGGISKQGNAMLRRLLVLGATACLRYVKKDPDGAGWTARLLARRPFKVAAVALANKMARIVWALLTKGGTYRMPAAAA